MCTVLTLVYWHIEFNLVYLDNRGRETDVENPQNCIPKSADFQSRVDANQWKIQSDRNYVDVSGKETPN
jgi:hypothetical protein